MSMTMTTDYQDYPAPAETIATQPEDFRPMLKPGEIRAFRCSVTGLTVKVFQVAGGGFTRVDVRDAAGRSLSVAHTFMLETDALNLAATLVLRLLSEAGL